MPVVPAPTPNAATLGPMASAGRAIVNAIAPLPYAVTWIDSRDEIFPAEVPPNVEREHSDPVQAAVPLLPAQSRVLVMSFSHAEDLDVVAACLPDPATLGERMQGVTCAGLLVTGTGRDGQPREVYLHHLVDNAWSMAEYGAQCVVWQTAVNPVVALELLATKAWSGSGVHGPEAFDAVPFLELLAAPVPEGYGSPWGMQERPTA